MLIIEPETVQVNRSPEALFDHLSVLKNMYELMPEAVQRFEADDDTFLFGLKGMPDVRLLLEEKKRPELLQFKAASSKLDFTLSIHIAPQNDISTLSIKFAGDFNPMMKMMVEKPLRTFIHALADKAAEL